MRRKLLTIVIVLVILTAGVSIFFPKFASASNPNGLFKLIPNPYVAGQDVEARFYFAPQMQQDVFYKLTINHNGYWWDSFFPYHLKYGHQTWVECRYEDCTHWYEGTIPSGEFEEIFISYTTKSSFIGTDPDGLSAVLSIPDKKRVITKVIPVTAVSP